MTTFDERERAFEAKFARDQEMLFKINARRNKLVALWAAERMKLNPAEAEAYGRAVVHSDFETAGDHDVAKKLLGDLTAAGVEVDEAEIEAVIVDKTVEARRQLIEAQD